MNPAHSKEFRLTLETKAGSYGLTLEPENLDGLVKYYDLLSEWNPRLHLVAPTSPHNFATRHILESLLLLDHLPRDARVADIGSGAGLPIIPCLIVRPDIQAVLIESSKKKSVFLREVLSRFGGTLSASVIAERFEEISAPVVSFVSSRALEQFEQIIPRVIEWSPGGAVLLLFGGGRLGTIFDQLGLAFTARLIPNSTQRFLYVVRK